jgi:hypothetical protein
MTLSRVVPESLEAGEGHYGLAGALVIEQIVDVDQDFFESLRGSLVPESTGGMMQTYLNALHNRARHWNDATQATELLPLTKVTHIASELSSEVCFEQLDAILTSLLPGPALVPGEAPKLAVEAGGAVGFETLELGPDITTVVRLRICHLVSHIAIERACYLELELTKTTPDILLAETGLPVGVPGLFSTRPAEQLRENVELTLRAVVNVEDEVSALGPLAEESLLRFGSLDFRCHRVGRVHCVGVCVGSHGVVAVGVVFAVLWEVDGGDLEEQYMQPLARRW